MRSGILAALMAAAPSLAAQTEPLSRPRLRAGILSGPIVMDGRLTEPSWAAADSIAGLIQVIPVEGSTPGGRTVVKVLASPSELVFGVVAYAGPGAPPTSFSKARDSDLDEEDYIGLVLDTFLDGRSGYVFAVNPSGARFDGVVVRQGEDIDDSWDTIWEASTARDGDTWSAEIRIPVRSLIFGSGLRSWGLNIERQVQATQEVSRWAGARQNIEVSQTSRAGLLEDLPRFSLGAGLSIRPAVSGGAGYPEPDASLDGSFKPSLDVTKQIGSNLLASLTVNTDFAETEVDSRRTNLTRFPLFFPEKRSFFLEGLDIFEFGPNLGQEVIPFFSRRIGLLEGRVVPLHAGLKLNGRAGQTNFGALLSKTGSVSGLVEGQLMGAARFRQNVLGESSVGAIATFGDPRGRGGAYTVAADAIYHTSHFRGNKNLTIGAWAARVSRDSLAGAREAYGLLVDYPNDRWDIVGSWKHIGDGFDPSLGFVPRRGIDRYRVGINFQPRPDRWGIQQLHFGQSFTLVTGDQGRWETYQVSLTPVSVDLKTGDSFESLITPQGERLVEPFEVADGVTIPAGSFHFVRYQIEARTAERRTVSVGASWSSGGFYTGTLHQLEGDITWRPSSQIILDLSAEHDIGRLPEGNFSATVVELGARVNFSPDLTLSSLIQFDNESQSWGSNTRLRWTFSPFGDLFVVYNHNLREVDNRLGFESNQLLVKAQYTVRY